MSIADVANSASSNLSSVQNYLNNPSQLLSPPTPSQLDFTKDASTYINSTLTQVTLKPQGFAGIAGFTFNYKGEIKTTFASEITDHYSETNSSVQDHMALQPETFTFRGIVSELSLAAPNSGLGGVLQTIQSGLTQVPAYLGQYTPQAVQKLGTVVTQAQNYLNTANQYLGQAKSLISLFGTPGATQQERAYAIFRAMRDSRWLAEIETPWGYFNNYVVLACDMIQPEETIYQSELVVTMKEMRFVNVTTSSWANLHFAGRAAFQQQPQTNNGATPGAVASLSSVFSATNSTGLSLAQPF